VDYYNYNIELPFSKKTINFREINTNEQIALSKATIIFSKNKESLNYNNFVVNVINNCVENKKEFLEINVIDYLLFLTKLRIVSIGSGIELQSESTDQNVKNVKITLDLNLFLKNLYEGSLKALEKNIIKEKEIEIKIKWPNLNCLNVFVKKDSKNDFELFINSYQEFVDYIKINEKIIKFENFTSNQKIKMLENLSISLIKKLQESIIEMLNFVKSYDLWGISILKDYTFHLYNLGFVDFIRLFFTYDLKSLYKELYYFSNANLPPNYILKISQSERKIYSSIIEEHQRTMENKETKYDFEQINKSGNKTVEDLALEFGDTPP
jgi:hypothetical protein